MSRSGRRAHIRSLCRQRQSRVPLEPCVETGGWSALSVELSNRPVIHPSGKALVVDGCCADNPSARMRHPLKVGIPVGDLIGLSVFPEFLGFEACCDLVQRCVPPAARNSVGQYLSGRPATRCLIIPAGSVTGYVHLMFRLDQHARTIVRLEKRHGTSDLYPSESCGTVEQFGDWRTVLAASNRGQWPSGANAVVSRGCSACSTPGRFR